MMWISIPVEKKNMFTIIHPDCRYLCSAFPQFFLHFKFFCVLPVLNLFPHLFIYFLNFPAFICLEFVWDTLFAVAAVQNKKWTPFSGWYGSPLFVPCPLFLLLCIWHYLVNLFVVIPSLFNSVFVCRCICLNVYREQRCICPLLFAFAV